MSFIDEPPDKRVNQERARQALATGADVVAVGCPFCMTMLEDGINATQGRPRRQGDGRGRIAVASGRSRPPKTERTIKSREARGTIQLFQYDRR